MGIHIKGITKADFLKMHHVTKNGVYVGFDPTCITEVPDADDCAWNEPVTLDINELAEMIHENAKDHGWWDEERTFGEIVALCHSELSEALEAYRNKEPMVWINDGKPDGIAVEMIDCIIRILDWCGKEDIDVAETIMIKHMYNTTRPYKHGGKVI